jgi:hypothetical protein
MQDLPDIWRQKHLKSLQDNMDSAMAPNNTSIIHANLQDDLESETKLNQSRPARSNVPKTPIHLLAEASASLASNNDPSKRAYFEEPSKGLRKSSSAPANNMNPLPWSSPSLRASPSDQLIAAILDGDVQGIRTVVRSKGDDLQSEFWKDLTRSILPLHRAISGLHFHGSEKLLIATIEVLLQLGADINAVDHAGNGVLHKSIQICTSKSVSAVINCLIKRGANPQVFNKDGDFPIHAECKR